MKGNGKNGIFSLLDSVFSKRELAAYFFLQFLGGAKDFLIIFAFSYAVDSFSNGKDLSAAFALLASSMVSFVALITFDSMIKEKMLVKLRSALLIRYKEKFISIDMHEAVKLDIAPVLNSYSSDLDRICHWFRWTLSKLLQLVFYFIIASAYCLYSSLKLTLVAIPVIILTMPVIMKAIGKLGAVVQKERSLSDRIAVQVSEMFHFAETVKAFNCKEQVCGEIARKLKGKQSQDFRAGMIKSLSSSLSFIFSYLPGILAAMAGSVMWSKGEITIGFLIAFVQIVLGRVSMFLPQLAEFASATKETKVYIERINSFLHKKDENEDGIAQPNATDTVVEFKDVCFSYPDSAFSLSDFSFSAARGETVALVGSSGCGKSTLLKLLMGLYNHYYSGTVRFEGIELKEWNQQSLRSRIAPVFQDSFLFKGSVDDNMNTEIDDSYTDGISELLSISGEEDCTRLSGGQRHQVEIARGLSKKADLYLLDEPLANLDYQEERRVIKQLKLIKNKTVIIAEHCLSAVEHCDKIIFISNGRIAESGTHDELMGMRGQYFSLYMKQNRGVSEML